MLQFTICPLVADQFLKFPFSTPVCFPFFALYEEIIILARLCTVWEIHPSYSLGEKQSFM